MHYCSSIKHSLSIEMESSLPPANEVSSKVIFSEACVSHFVQGGGGVCLYMMSLPAWLPGPIFLQGGLCLGEVSVQGGSLGRGKGVLCAGGSREKSGRYASYWNAFLFYFLI